MLQYRFLSELEQTMKTEMSLLDLLRYALDAANYKRESRAEYGMHEAFRIRFDEVMRALQIVEKKLDSATKCSRPGSVTSSLLQKKIQFEKRDV